MTDLISVTRLSELVGLIYDCAIEPARWPIAMEAIRNELAFHNATLDLILLPSGVALNNVVCNVPTAYQMMMSGAGPDVIDQWGGAEKLLSLPMTRPAVLSRVNPAFDHETTTNPYFVAFARPQGIVDAMAIPLARDDQAIGSLAFGRHASAGPIGEREVTIAHLLMPHLQRAATINRMLEGAMTAQAGFSAALGALTVPIILVEHDLRIVHANAAALRLLERRTPIRSLHGYFDTVVPVASKAVATAVAQAALDEGALGRRGLGVPLIGPEGQAAALHVLPLTGRRRRVGEAVAALFLAEAHASFVAPTEVAAALFDLTPGEARVFDQLVSGRSQTAIAIALGIERSTVKTHLARLFDKVGVRRQAELVRVAASLALPATVPSA